MLATADFNGDGKLDIVSGYSGGLSVLLGNGDGTFQPSVMTSIGGDPYFIAVADFNLDGKPDIVVVSAGGYSPLSGEGRWNVRSRYFDFPGAVKCGRGGL